jgi:hypothetical protein
MNYKYILFTICLLSFNAKAQEYNEDWDYYEQEDTISSKAELIFKNTARLDDLIDKRKRINQNKRTLNAFRIQIYSGSRSGSSNALNRFKKQHPGMFVETSYEQPYFKTKVGAYRTKLEALRAVDEIKKNFRSAFIFEEKITIDML